MTTPSFNPQDQNWQSGLTPPQQAPQQPPQGTYQPPHPWAGSAQTFQSPSPRPKKHTGLKVAAIILGGLLLLAVGTAISAGHKETITEITPGPTVTEVGPTVTVTATVAPTAITAANDHVARLQATWTGMSATAKSNIRDSWRAAKGNATKEASLIQIYLDAFKDAMPGLTAAEVRAYFEWTLLQT